jgi:site-specific DNA recombinase
MTAAICYSRFSARPRAEQCESVEVQLDRCRAYCKAHEYEIAGEYADRELSGGRADNRPALQDAIDQTAKLKGILVVTKLDRLARNAQDARAILADQLHKKGADVAIIQMQVNTRSAIGKLFYGLLAEFAEFERAQIVERTSEAMLFHQANGRRMGRTDRCPYGTMPNWDGPMLEKVDKETGQVARLPAALIVNPEEQTVIEQIRRLRAEGMGSKAIARALDAQNITCRGHCWHHSTIRAILNRAGRLSEAS